MLQKPGHWKSEYAKQFKDPGIVEAYCYRPPYPAEAFDILEQDTTPDPWSTLHEVITKYRTNKDTYQPYDMLEALEEHGLFQKVGERITAPVPFVQSIDDYIESYHSRSSFSRERTGQKIANAFDEEARKVLLGIYSDGFITQQINGSIVWGIPGSL